MTSSKKYPGKLLLFGEYTVLHGGQALAVPYEKLNAFWSFSSQADSEGWQGLLNYLEQLPPEKLPGFDFEKFKIDIKKGLELKSYIPFGYGVGSSGALTAALWDRYGSKVDEINALRKILAAMESYFHDSSSGLDPLVSYLNKPVLVRGGEYHPLDLPPLPPNIELIDSKIQRRTAPLVAWYKSNFLTQEGAEQRINQLTAFNDEAIDAFVNGNDEALAKALRQISEWQYRYFDFLIPTTVKEEWKRGLLARKYYKLCGAGGGGFFLAWDVGGGERIVYV